eukprot:TRINITY_DN5884_c0_g1_i1.p3 TRINITY_DN5884_c0_g1~~TRINITY_DN5884_c0_g1_i1.p3  ORF type:complete len:121 (-),score=3.07 TRINITY_DN5884_c0_g1_i1:91-453(-)
MSLEQLTKERESAGEKERARESEIVDTQRTDGQGIHSFEDTRKRAGSTWGKGDWSPPLRRQRATKRQRRQDFRRDGLLPCCQASLARSIHQLPHAVRPLQESVDTALQPCAELAHGLRAR